MAIDWARIREGCPRCGSSLQWHSLSVWCLRCGWAKNWESDPEAAFMARGARIVLTGSDGARVEGSLVDMRGEIAGKPIVVIPEEEM